MTVWTSIESAIQQAGYSGFSINQKQSVAGGDISQAYIISNHQHHFFVKLNQLSFFDNFEQESLGLSFLAGADQFVVPEVIGFGQADANSYLVLEYIAMNRQGDEGLFANALAQLHSINHAEFGFQADNYIGATAQKNRWMSQWGDFFVERRLEPQFQWLHKRLASAIPNHLRQQQQPLLEKCRQILNIHAPQPCLVHGDLWQGNFSFSKKGKPIIYDPACYFGDREVDLAMLEMFGQPSEHFYHSYYQIQSKQPQSKVRKEIYNLYHWLNHANLFGQSYLSQVSSTVNRIMSS